nr:RNA degradosome polyphosphate kinase [Verrucomicrobiota bacterium]
VRSIVGRFLEHSRIFVCENAGDPKVFVGSADWMPRNFFRRVEVLFPIEDPAIRDRIIHQILGAQLADNTKASLLDAEGAYSIPRQPKGTEPRNNQSEFIALALRDAPARSRAKADGEPARKLAVAVEPRPN